MLGVPVFAAASIYFPGQKNFGQIRRARSFRFAAIGFCSIVSRRWTNGRALGAAVAQLLYTETVAGSNPAAPTIPVRKTLRDYFSARLANSPFASRVFIFCPAATCAASRKTFPVAASVVIE